MASFKIGNFLDAIESRWSLAVHIGAAMISFGLPAWAVSKAHLFSDYAPFSWVVAGFVGVFVWVCARLIWQAAARLGVKNRWDNRILDQGSIVNPLDVTFERKRIILNDFVLPSWAYIDGKTFVDCDLIGPANIYFRASNSANPIRLPKIDAVWLEPEAKFNNGFIFNNCIFKNCSFQRITFFASIENYDSWKDNPNINWISIPPSAEHIERRHQVLRGEAAAQESMRLVREAESQKALMA